MNQIQQHIAIFGCGQLAQMIAQAGIKLGQRFSFIADSGEDTRCVDGLGNIIVLDKAITAQELYLRIGEPDIVTVEKEMVDSALLKQLKQYANIYPTENAIYITQNRIREKNYLKTLGIPTAEFVVIQSIDVLRKLSECFSFPIYIKAAESGYDGYNQWRINSIEDLSQPALLAAIANKVELVAEKHVDYSREVSIIASRNVSGEIVIYPLMENRHEDGILIATIAPAPKPALFDSAAQIIKKILIDLDYVGILTVECFETKEGIVVNELAPRVHNSGHWTIEGAASSQFENHCRAITNMGLGSVEMIGLAGLVNMLGQHGNKAKLDALNTNTETRFYYHDYGKTERPGRKLGHVGIGSSSYSSLNTAIEKIMKELYGDRYS